MNMDTLSALDGTTAGHIAHDENDDKKTAPFVTAAAAAQTDDGDHLRNIVRRTSSHSSSMTPSSPLNSDNGSPVTPTMGSTTNVALLSDAAPLLNPTTKLAALKRLSTNPSLLKRHSMRYAKYEEEVVDQEIDSQSHMTVPLAPGGGGESSSPLQPSPNKSPHKRGSSLGNTSSGGSFSSQSQHMDGGDSPSSSIRAKRTSRGGSSSSSPSSPDMNRKSLEKIAATLDALNRDEFLHATQRASRYSLSAVQTGTISEKIAPTALAEASGVAAAMPGIDADSLRRTERRDSAEFGSLRPRRLSTARNLTAQSALSPSAAADENAPIVHMHPSASVIGLSSIAPSASSPSSPSSGGGKSATEQLKDGQQASRGGGSTPPKPLRKHQSVPEHLHVQSSQERRRSSTQMTAVDESDDVSYARDSNTARGGKHRRKTSKKGSAGHSSARASDEEVSPVSGTDDGGATDEASEQIPARSQHRLSLRRRNKHGLELKDSNEGSDSSPRNSDADVADVEVEIRPAQSQSSSNATAAPRRSSREPGDLTSANSAAVSQPNQQNSALASLVTQVQRPAQSNSRASVSYTTVPLQPPAIPVAAANSSPTATAIKQQYAQIQALQQQQQQFQRSIQPGAPAPGTMAAAMPPARPPQGQLQRPLMQQLEHQTFSTQAKYLLPPQPEHLRGRKTLVLDLDETLVHSSFRPVPTADFVIKVEIERVWHKIYVCKRPGVDVFLDAMSKYFELIVFTASLSKYADPVIDHLDPKGHITGRLFRESCTYIGGNYVKDLRRIGRDMTQTLIIDNSAMCFSLQPENGLLCVSWFDQVDDTELIALIPWLERLAHDSDVYGVLDMYRAHCNIA